MPIVLQSLDAIVKSAWANGLDAAEALELITSVGHAISANDLAKAWSALDAEYDAYVLEHSFAPYSEVSFVPQEVITSSINEHGYVLYGHKTVTVPKRGITVLNDVLEDIDLDSL